MPHDQPARLFRLALWRIFPVLLALTAVSCANALPLPGANAPGASLLPAGVVRDTRPSVPDAALGQVVEGNNTFAFGLYRTVRNQEGNLFLSPYSISLALSMAYVGARGSTASQMSNTLGFHMPADQLSPALNALDLRLASQEPSTFQLNIANSMWGQNDFPFLPAFTELVGRNYSAAMRGVDFTTDAKREQARLAINTWTSDQTNGKIKELIDQGSLNEMTRLILANAVYFKGEWENTFNPATADVFTNTVGKQVDVQMMARRANYPYFEAPQFQAVAFPYKGGRISMLALLPAEGEFQSFEAALNPALFQDVLAKMQDQDIKVYLPKFSFESRFKLGQALSQMGMADAFDPGQADFTGMYDASRIGQRLFISDVLHNAWVSVDERGTEAAAATGVIMEIVSMPKEVRFDRPFIFLIYDRPTSSILFLGKVVDPSKAE